MKFLRVTSVTLHEKGPYLKIFLVSIFPDQTK